MNQQEVFDKIAAHLLKQNAPALAPDAYGIELDCVYHAPNGLKCAAGVLIPDNLYDKAMEGLFFNTVYRMHEGLRDALQLSPAALLLVNELQHVHDDRTPDQWEEELREIAENHDLEFRGYPT